MNTHDLKLNWQATKGKLRILAPYEAGLSVVLGNLNKSVFQHVKLDWVEAKSNFNLDGWKIALSK